MAFMFLVSIAIICSHCCWGEAIATGLPERVPGAALIERGYTEVERTSDYERGLAHWYTRRTPSVTSALDAARTHDLLENIIVSTDNGEVWESNSTVLFRYWSLNRTLEKPLEVALAKGWVNQTHKVAEYADWTGCKNTLARYAMITPSLDAATLQFVRHMTGIPEPTTTVFAGCNNSATALHYDNSRTIFLQLRGQKRFVLLAPEDGLNAYFAPAAHPYYRQSLLEPADLVKPIDYGRFPFAEKLIRKAQVVDLQPGDALVIPKRWSHFAVSLSDDSLGLSVRGAVDDRAKTASTTVSLPFELEWTYGTKADQVENVIDHIFPEAAQRLRYLERWRKAIELSRGELCGPVPVKSFNVTDAKEPIQPYKERVADMVKQLRKRFKILAESEETMQILLMDFVDDVILTVLDPDLAVNLMLELHDKQSFRTA
jgi:hypothetical protein